MHHMTCTSNDSKLVSYWQIQSRMVDWAFDGRLVILSVYQFVLVFHKGTGVSNRLVVLYIMFRKAQGGTFSPLAK